MLTHVGPVATTARWYDRSPRRIGRAAIDPVGRVSGTHRGQPSGDGPGRLCRRSRPQGDGARRGGAVSGGKRTRHVDRYPCGTRLTRRACSLYRQGSGRRRTAGFSLRRGVEAFGRPEGAPGPTPDTCPRPHPGRRRACCVCRRRNAGRRHGRGRARRRRDGGYRHRGHRGRSPLTRWRRLGRGARQYRFRLEEGRCGRRHRTGRPCLPALLAHLAGCRAPARAAGRARPCR